jgi:dephospho-CoA kinase
MMKVGLTGGVGSGKSTALAGFKRGGAVVASCDAWVREELETNALLKKKIAQVFGAGTIRSGRVDRRALAAIVFKEAAKVKRLNALVHPWVKRRLLDFFLRNRRRALVAVEVPLLFEAKFDKFFDVTIGVATDPGRQRERLKKRGPQAASDFRRRMRWQLMPEAKLSRCDFVIDNNGSKRSLFSQINKLMEDQQWKS